MDRFRQGQWRGRGGYGQAGGRPAAQRGGQGQAGRPAEGGIPVPRGPNPVGHGRGPSVDTVASWEGDREFLAPRGAPQGVSAQQTSLAVAIPQNFQEPRRQYSAQEVEQICERYAANERESMQRQLNQKDQELAESRCRGQQLEEQIAGIHSRMAEQDTEIAQMSRNLASLQVRNQGYGQTAMVPYARPPARAFVPAQAYAQPPPPARRPEIVQRGPGLNLGAQPFRPVPVAAPAAPSQPRRQGPPQMALVPRAPLAAPTGPRDRRPSQPAVPGPSTLSFPTPQRLLPGSPSHKDDVFDPSVPDKLPWRPAQFQQQSISFLVSSSCNMIKGIIYKQGFRQIPDAQIPGGREFIGLCIKHVEKARLAYEMLNDRERYWNVVAGVTLGLLVDKIFVQTALLSYPNDPQGHVAAFQERYQAEKEALTLDDDLRRYTILENRIDAAKNITRLPGFWNWVKERSRQLAEEVFPNIAITVPINNTPEVKEALFRAANEYLRIHIRMMQEPSIYTFDFIKAGYPWTAETMLNRDPQVPNDALTEQRCQWVTQCATTPLVHEEKFEKTPGENKVFISKDVLLKAEMTLCPRKGNLRQ